ncbi:Amino-acid permease [Venturia nashicola]|uniref:Amino-acid permease n=1 Tax=Venturia nashicola TaxID=86259 RepID=A0A4Z1P8Z8_9PEZI|nr:Amino-acid permease [Venturia nashicola]TLD37827.1 Amino-acid permease [Venturia nashicola]
MEVQNQVAQKNNPADCDLDDLVNQMSDFSIEKTAGDILHDIKILESIERYMNQNHWKSPVSNIPNANVQQLEKQARMLREQQAYTDLVEGLEQVYCETVPFMIATIRQYSWTAKNFNGFADGSKRRAWLNFAKQCGFSA